MVLVVLLVLVALVALVVLMVVRAPEAHVFSLREEVLAEAALLLATPCSFSHEDDAREVPAAQRQAPGRRDPAGCLEQDLAEPEASNR